MRRGQRRTKMDRTRGLKSFIATKFVWCGEIHEEGRSRGQDADSNKTETPNSMDFMFRDSRFSCDDTLFWGARLGLNLRMRNEALKQPERSLSGKLNHAGLAAELPCSKLPVGLGCGCLVF
jgi:hypothetical protein